MGRPQRKIVKGLTATKSSNRHSSVDCGDNENAVTGIRTRSKRKKSLPSKFECFALDKSYDKEETPKLKEMRVSLSKILCNEKTKSGTGRLQLEDFQCELCSQHFKSKNLLSLHLYHHDTRTIFQCNLCQESFSTPESLMLHVNAHDDIVKPFKCGLCLSSFLESKALIDHLNENHSDNIFKNYRCSECALVFTESSKLIDHCLQQHPPHCDKFKCDRCDECFSSREDLSSHIQISCLKHENIQLENGDSPMRVVIQDVCDDEDFDYSMECESSDNDDAPSNYTKKRSIVRQRKVKPPVKTEQMKDHVEEIVLEGREHNTGMIECDICGEEQLHEKDLIKHRDDHFCDGKYSVSCKSCSQSFASFDLLSDHIGPDKCRPYQCEQCQHFFSLQSSLLAHQVKEHFDFVNHNSDNFVCSVCDKKMVRRDLFVQHAKTHATDKLIVCNLCSREFTTPDSVFSHLKVIHSLIRNPKKKETFRCDLCNICCFSKEYLTQHRIFIHNITDKQGSTDLSAATISTENRSETLLSVFECEICGKQLLNEDDIERHKSDHFCDGKYTITCPGCNQTFDSFEVLSEHVGPQKCKPYKCDICDQIFSLESLLLVHTANDHASAEGNGKGGFTCSVCQSHIKRKDTFLRHVISHAKNKCLKCKLCGHFFKTPETLFKHLTLVHSLIQVTDRTHKFPCDVCNVPCYGKKALLRHRSTIHNIEEEQAESSPLPVAALQNCSAVATIEGSVFDCDICNQQLGDKEAYMKHRKEHFCDGKYSVSCKCCQQRFDSFSLLSDHIGPNGCMPYICELCGDFFSLEYLLLIHKVKYHSDPVKSKGDLTCSVCGKRFSKKESLLRHASTHTKDKCISCKICLHEYPTPELLFLHLKGIHSLLQARQKGYNFPCEICQMFFASKETLTRHHSMIHDDEEKPLILDSTQCSENASIDVSVIMDCDICGMQLQGQESFINHRNNHFCEGKYYFNCKSCKEKFDSLELLSDHIGPDKCQPYFCDVCGQPFSLEFLLLAHKVKDHYQFGDQIDFPCSFCEKTFDRKDKLIRHSRTHCRDKCIKCNLCSRAFPTPELIHSHLKVFHSLMPVSQRSLNYPCDVCNMLCYTKDILVQHRSIIHNMEEGAPLLLVVEANSSKASKPPDTSTAVDESSGPPQDDKSDMNKQKYQCPVCYETFNNFIPLRRHMCTHLKRYLCSLCGKSFPYRYLLENHVNAFHSVLPYKCNSCDKRFSSERLLQCHARIHTGEKPHECPVCHKRFRILSSLCIHSKLHSHIKPFKCSLCDYRGMTKDYLKKHMITHSTEKKHTCETCRKAFLTKNHLQTHIKRVHLQIKKNVCTICGHRFAQKYHLNNHLRTHTKEKPFLCNICNRSFTIKPNLISHIKKVHTYEVVEQFHNSWDTFSNTIVAVPESSVVESNYAEPTVVSFDIEIETTSIEEKN